MITLKRGDTFYYTTNLKDNLGNILTGITSKLKSQIRNSLKKLIAEVSIEETDTPGEYIFKVSDTNNFPITKLYFDFQYTDIENDINASSDTFVIDVIEDVTQP